MKLDEGYKGAVCEIKDAENILLAVGYIKDISDDSIVIGERDNLMSVIEKNQEVKISGFSSSLGFKVLKGTVSDSNEKVLEISDLEEIIDRERRHYIRVETNLTAGVYGGVHRSMKDSDWTKVLVKDISLSGLSFEMDKKLKAETVLWVQLKLETGECCLPCRVVRNVDGSVGGNMKYGCEVLFNEREKSADRDIINAYLMQLQRDLIRRRRKVSEAYVAMETERIDKKTGSGEKKGLFSMLFGKKDKAEKSKKSDSHSESEKIKEGSSVSGEIKAVPEPKKVSLPIDFIFTKEEPIYEIWKNWEDDGKPDFNPIELIENQLIELYSKSNNYNLRKDYETFVNDVHMLAETAVMNAKVKNAIGDSSDTDVTDESADAETAETQADEIISNFEAALSEPLNVDAAVIVRKIADNMRAVMFMFPPLGDGETIDELKIKQELEDNSVLSGIDEEMLSRMLDEKLYLKFINIAEGKLPVDGEPGTVTEVVSRKQGVDIRETEKGTIDYKELNLIKNVKKDDVLCEIVYPTVPVDGMDVTGKEITAAKGVAAVIPKGKNTHLSDDGTKLLASIDGYVNIVNNAYSIENVLQIKGDIDNSTGNITFDGNILIKGDVQEGFSVISDGTVTIEGSVGANVTIKAGKDITIRHGVNGGTRGNITAGGKIRTKFIQSCAVTCYGIEAEAILDSTVECEDYMTVSRGKGTLAGGKFSVGKLIEAIHIGNEKSSVSTEIILGQKPNLLRRRDAAKLKLDETLKKYEEFAKSIDYMKKNADNLTPERKALFSKSLIQVKLLLSQKEKEEKEFRELDEEVHNTGYCRVKAYTAYPGTVIRIGTENHIIQTETKGLDLNNSAN
ncbi:MAG: FapA family protein [Oscillospiraceae bacterium]|jgi:uncharacterized protein (DUF342 family)|nr:FapA family protein [Oscillospiraceae bacterium]